MIKSKTMDITIILLKWYKNETFLDSKINNIGEKIDEIKTIKKIFKTRKFFLKYFLYKK